MPQELLANYIAAVSAGISALGAAVSIFNARVTGKWKRIDLASSQLSLLDTEPLLQFATRCLDLDEGKLYVPIELRGWLAANECYIEHDKDLFIHALKQQPVRGSADPRVMMYRMAMDAFLTWLSRVADGLDRGNYAADDLRDVGYWVQKCQSEGGVWDFVSECGFSDDFEFLKTQFQGSRIPLTRVKALGSRKTRSLTPPSAR